MSLTYPYLAGVDAIAHEAEPSRVVETVANASSRTESGGMTLSADILSKLIVQYYDEGSTIP